MVKGLPAKSGDMGLIPGLDRFPYAVGQLGLCTTTAEACAPRQRLCSATREAAPVRGLHTATGE